MNINYDQKKNTLRIDDNNAGAVYFVIDGIIDPSEAIIFEVSKK